MQVGILAMILDLFGPPMVLVEKIGCLNMKVM